MTIALAGVVGGMALLLACLSGADARIRRRAAEAERLRRRYLPRAEQGIAGYLAGSPDLPAPSGAAERALLLAVGLEALADLRGSERQRLAGLLERLGYVAEATAALRSRQAAARRRAAECLAVIATPATLPGLMAGVADGDVLVRCACARALAEIGGDDALRAVTATAERDAARAPGQVAAIVLALGSSHPAALAPLLAGASGPRLRALAAEVAGALRLAQHAGSLRSLLGAEDHLAAVAAGGLGAIGDIDAVGDLAALAADDRRSPAVRVAAVTALGAIGDASAVPCLEPLLRAPDWSLRTAAGYALAGLSEPGRAALRRAAGSERKEIRDLAGAVLGS